MTYQLIYSSQATVPMSVAELEEILVDARAGNEKRNITGALVYIDGIFLQVLEGERETVLSLMRSIEKDTRHHSVKVFHQAEVDRPTFGNWRMAYLGATPEQMAVSLLESSCKRTDARRSAANHSSTRAVNADAEPAPLDAGGRS